MVDKERVQMLVDDLRNPEVRQAQRALNDGVGFCCLGRACEVYRKATGKGEWVQKDSVPTDDGFAYIMFRAPVSSYGYESCAGVLPQPVVDWYGFGISNPFLKRADGSEDSATNLNDRSFCTLPQIADAFERTFLAEEK